MKIAIENVRKFKTVPTADDLGQDLWSMRSTLFRFLTRYTGDNLQRLVEVVTNDNGWEAWRLLDVNCEPSVGMTETQVVATYAGLITHRAKNPKETCMLMAEMEQHAKRVAEVTGSEV